MEVFTCILNKADWLAVPVISTFLSEAPDTLRTEVHVAPPSIERSISKEAFQTP